MESDDAQRLGKLEENLLCSNRRACAGDGDGHVFEMIRVNMSSHATI